MIDGATAGTLANANYSKYPGCTEREALLQRARNRKTYHAHELRINVLIGYRAWHEQDSDITRDKQHESGENCIIK